MWIKYNNITINLEKVTSVRLRIEDLHKDSKPFITFCIPDDDVYFPYETIEKAKEGFENFLLELEKQGKFICP